jgi:hypothetical protein
MGLDKTRREHEKVKTEMERLMDADDADLDKIGNLSVKSSTFETRLGRLASGKLFDAQSNLQYVILDLGRRAEILWIQARARLVDEAHQQIAQILHPDLRVGDIAQISPAAERVIAAERTFEIRLNPACSDPLADTPGNATFSERRPRTVELIKQEAHRLLERLPLLLECCVRLPPGLDVRHWRRFQLRSPQPRRPLER